MKKRRSINMTKELFVRTSLKELLQDIDTDIVDVYYTTETSPLREDVTCDGLYGIAKDVVTKIYR